MAKGILLDFESITRPTDGDPGPLLREIQNLGYEVYSREFLAVCDYVMYVDASRKGLDSAEHFLEAVFDHLGQKPKKTEIMSLAPVLEELHRYVVHDDIVRAIPALAKEFRIAVISALPPFWVARALEPVKPNLTAVVTPREARAIPPNPAAYRAALTAMKARAKEVSLVSSRCPDLAVAKPLGMRPIFLRRGTEEAGCAQAVMTIRSIEELATTLSPASKHAPASAPSAGASVLPATSAPVK